jgi:alkylation response protein AidB-like acyl-CoA dehydrogenase
MGTANHKLGPLGAEPELPEMARMFQDSLHKFSADCLRPIGQKLDRMTPEEVIAPGSPYWEARSKYLELGVSLDALGELPPAEQAKMFCILFEELGWGDAGLAISFGAAVLPAYLSILFKNEYLRSLAPDEVLGCWAITEPDHGSDMLDPNRLMFHPEGNYGRPNCVATLRGDEVILNGQKAAWVSNGSIAKVCILYCAADVGQGPDSQNGVCLVFPLDLKGVSRGKPLNKLGQRALNQGEIFFDNVKLSKAHILAGPENYHDAVIAIHSLANGLMGATFTGVARAAYELALDYAHERKAGGVPIIRHQSVATRLFHMFRKIEAARALTHRVVHYNLTAPSFCLHAAMTSKITGTQTAFEVTSDALQIFGGNGLTTEYPMEKLLRDARASLIEDGCNEILAIKGGYHLIDRDRF